MSEFDFDAGEVLLIDKPLRWTSFDVIKKMRGMIRMKKIGHAGTLDPLATGLLIICTGKATKKINELQGFDKCYTGTISLGKTTPSYDLETEFDSESPIDGITENEIHDCANRLTGELQQIPPVYSAIKIDGKRAYTKARKNEKVEMKSRLVTVKRFDITSCDLPNVRFSIECTKGTYIRSIAHDFGQLLGCGAHLSELRRTSIGNYDLQNALTLDDFQKMINQ